MEKLEYIKDEFEKIQISLTAQQTEQFYKYYELLTEKNKVMNLTAITEFQDVVRKHFIDSLMVKEVLVLKENASLIDVGTGAGFPGIPLKIVYPHLELVLLDSLNKRVQFLNDVINQLKLQKISAVHGRAEDIAKRLDYREQFDYCVSRAVANLASLSEYCLPFVKVGGSFIAYKSEKVEEEIKSAARAIELLGGQISVKKEFMIPGTELYRCILNIWKESGTPGKYPRKAGKPLKEPL